MVNATWRANVAEVNKIVRADARFKTLRGMVHIGSALGWTHPDDPAWDCEANNYEAASDVLRFYMTKWKNPLDHSEPIKVLPYIDIEISAPFTTIWAPEIVQKVAEAAIQAYAMVNAEVYGEGK